MRTSSVWGRKQQERRLNMRVQTRSRRLAELGVATDQQAGGGGGCNDITCV